METQSPPRSPRLTQKHLEQAFLFVPIKPTQIDDLARIWLKLFPWATAWQIQYMACRLVNLGRIVRTGRGVYVRPIAKSEPDDVTKRMMNIVLSQHPDTKQGGVIAEKEVIVSPTPNLFTNLSRIEVKYERKIAAIWKFIGTMREKGIEPTQELFEAIYNETNA